MTEINEKNIRQFIDLIEPKLEQLWDTLCIFKSGQIEKISEKFINFQSELADCQILINGEFQKVRTNIKSFKTSRNNLSKENFKIGEKQLKDCEQAILHLIYLSKSIGDAYAWFFLQNDKEILNEHLKSPENLLLPSGYLGRLGEIEFIRSNKMIGDNLIIYHGTTSILRIGDISLVNLKTFKLTGIAELKTDSIDGNKLQLRIIAYGKEDRMKQTFSHFQEKKESKREDKIKNEEREARLEKQIQTMLSALKVYSNAQPSVTKNIYNNSYLGQLKHLFEYVGKEKMIFSKVDDGLLFIGARLTQEKLSQRLFDNPKNTEKSDNEKLTKHVCSILDPESDKNETMSGSIHYNKEGKINTLMGVKPIFWSDLPVDCLKQIYFYKLALITIYNPIFFGREMNKRGFHIEFVESFNKKCLVKRIGERQMIMENMGYYFSLIINHLVDEATVLKIMDTISLESENFTDSTKIETHFYQV